MTPIAVIAASKTEDQMFRIATWNLERPRMGSHRNTAILKRIHDIRADVWILTETNAVIDLGPAYHAVVSSRLPFHKPGENWTTIWSRLRHLSNPRTYDSNIAVCAEIDAPGGRPLLVYGTVLPYHGDRGPSGIEPNWAEHYNGILRQGEDWQRLRANFPTHRICVAGDLNQSRDGRRWPWGEFYGTRHGRGLLTAAFECAGLSCATEVDLVASGILCTCSTIDHICLDTESAGGIAVGAWEGRQDDGVRLSDHNGIYVDVALG